MKGDIELYEGTGKLIAESYGRKLKVRQYREGQEETSSLDGPLCAILALLLALVFFGFVVYYLSM